MEDKNRRLLDQYIGRILECKDAKKWRFSEVEWLVAEGQVVSDRVIRAITLDRRPVEPGARLVLGHTEYFDEDRRAALCRVPRGGQDGRLTPSGPYLKGGLGPHGTATENTLPNVDLSSTICWWCIITDVFCYPCATIPIGARPCKRERSQPPFWWVY